MNRTTLRQQLDAATRAGMPARLATYFAGCLLFSLGVKFFIDANLGVDPLNCLVIALVHHIALPFVRIGVVSSVITALFLLAWMIWNRRWPPITPFFTMAIVGFLIDLWNYIGLETITVRLLGHYALLLTGLLMDSYASALIIMSGIGIR